MDHYAEQMKFLDIKTESDKKKNRSFYQEFFEKNNYRKAAAHSWNRCANCFNFLPNQSIYTKNYYKCLLIALSHSAATDVRLSGICDKFQPREE